MSQAADGSRDSLANLAKKLPWDTDVTVPVEMATLRYTREEDNSLSSSYDPVPRWKASVASIYGYIPPFLRPYVNQKLEASPRFIVPEGEDWGYYDQ